MNFGLEEKLEKIRKRVKGVEDTRVASEVFDTSTLLTLYDLANKGVIGVLNGVVKTGKEANVFYAEDKEGSPLAVKIHRVATGDYKAMLKYIEGDRRFKLKKTKRSIVYTWVRKEFKNLQRARECGVRVPEPLAFKNNVLVMKFIGSQGRPAEMLRDFEMKDPERMFNLILGDVKKLYCQGNLVHADLSEYNVLVWRNKPVLIDLSQAVILEHPSSREFLKRDVANLIRFFKSDIGVEEALKIVEDC